MLRLASTLAALLVAANAHARPVVEKVDPPSWWVRHTWSPLQVLVTGQGFSGARVTSLGSGIEPAVRHVSDDGRYLFVYLDTAPILRPSVHRFRIETASGAAEFELRFDPPVSKAGRFRSFTPDDVVYLLVPDRFSNGDPANDSPAELGAPADRSSPAAYHGGDFRGIPHLYYGDEIALGGGGAGRESTRIDFPGGFAGDRVDAFTPEGRTGDAALVFDALRRLLVFRRDHPAVRRGRLTQLVVGDDQYAYLRSAAEEHVLVVLDRSRAARIELEVDDVGLGDGLRLASWIAGEPEVRVSAGKVQIPGPRDVHIYWSRR